MKSNPEAENRKLTCPECSKTFTEKQLEPYQFEDSVNWINCPNCGIGQHKDRWCLVESKTVVTKASLAL